MKSKTKFTIRGQKVTIETKRIRDPLTGEDKFAWKIGKRKGVAGSQCPKGPAAEASRSAGEATQEARRYIWSV